MTSFYRPPGSGGYQAPGQFGPFPPGGGFRPDPTTMQPGIGSPDMPLGPGGYQQPSPFGPHVPMPTPNNLGHPDMPLPIHQLLPGRSPVLAPHSPIPQAPKMNLAQMRTAMTQLHMQQMMARLQKHVNLHSQYATNTNQAQ